MTTKFQTYSEYADSTSSEKLTLAHVSAFQRLYNFTLDSGNIYKRVTNHVVTAVKRLGSSMTQVNTKVEVTDVTKFYFEMSSNTLYVYNLTADIASDKVIANYRLFFSSGPVALSWDLSDNGLSVEYIARIQAAPAFKSKVGTDQKGISLTGQGNLVLENTDGYFDNLYDKLTFESKAVEIYSFHRDLKPSEAKIIYRGSIADKSFTASKVTFKVKDSFFKLDERVPLTPYTESDSVSQQFVGNFRRRLYGKLNGLLIRSIDQISTGYTLTGTVSALNVGDTNLIGFGTSFLDETSPGDLITILNNEYQIEAVNSDTSITISDSDGFEVIFASQPVTNIPERPYRKKNRDYIVADHAIRQVTTDLVRHPQLNRVEVLSSEGFEEDDVIEVGPYTATVNRVSGNLITTKLNLPALVSTPATVFKRPISNVYLEGKRIVLDDITSITNVIGSCQVEISNESEFNIALNKALPSFADLVFTNGSRDITTTADVDLTQYVQPRDWIKTNSAPDVEFYEILSVSGQSISLRIPFAEANTTETGTVRLPELVGDDSNVSCDVLGKTEDGTPSGVWLKTGSEVIKDLLSEGDLATFIDTAGFDEAKTDASQLMSLALPLSITSRSLPTIRSVVDIINQSIFGSLVLTNELNITYNILDVGLPDQNIRRITESDNVKWSLKSKAGKLYKSALSQYRFLDFDNVTKTETSKSIDFTSTYVTDFETSVNTEELDLYVYNQNDAQELTERSVYYNSLSESIITLVGSLSLSDIEMGDKVLLELDRLYTRLGDFTTNEKVGTVIGVARSGDSITLEISDLGNLYNRSAVIAADTSVAFASADSDEKIISSYITDENGLVDTDEDTVNTNLIT